MPNSRHSAAIFSPSSSRATNFSRSSMGSHTFQGILRPPQKAPLCYPCLQNELSPFFQEGQPTRPQACLSLDSKLRLCHRKRSNRGGDDAKTHNHHWCVCGKVLASQASRAEPSADLVFCSKMPSARERISCYDAAARIAATSRQPTIAVAPVAAKSPSLAPEGPAVVIDVPRFQGFYAALGGSYGLGAPFNFSVFDTLQFFQGTASPHGASFVGSLGYNLQISHAVVGVEFS